MNFVILSIRSEWESNRSSGAKPFQMEASVTDKDRNYLLLLVLLLLSVVSQMYTNSMLLS